MNYEIYIDKFYKKNKTKANKLPKNELNSNNLIININMNKINKVFIDFLKYIQMIKNYHLP